MNRRKLTEGLFDPGDDWFLPFALCGALFALGVALGTFASATVSDGMGDRLGAYLAGLAVGGAPGTLAYFWSACAFPLAVFLLGFSVPGVVLIPAVSLLRGFTLAFALSSFVRAFGGEGALMGLTLVGMEAAVTVPVLLILSTCALRASFWLTRLSFSGSAPGPGVYTVAYFLRFFAAMILLLLICAGERAVIGWAIDKFPIFS